MQRLYKINCKLTLDELRDRLDSLDEIQQQTLYELYTAVHNISITEQDGTAANIAIMTEAQVLELNTLAALFNIDIEINDISDEVIKTRGTDVSTKYNNKWIEFMVVAFLEDYIPLDSILEKISDVGIDGIDDLDRNLLEFYSTKGK